MCERGRCCRRSTCEEKTRRGVVHELAAFFSDVDSRSGGAEGRARRSSVVSPRERLRCASEFCV